MGAPGQKGIWGTNHAGRTNFVGRVNLEEWAVDTGGYFSESL